MNHRLVLILSALIAGIATLLLVGCGGDDDANSGSTQSLTVYSGRVPDLIEPVFEDFTEATGIEVEARYGDTAELAVTLTEEGDASPADVFIAQDAGALGAVAERGLFTELPNRILDQVPAAYRSPQGEWVGISGRARVIAYGEEISEDDVPDSVFDLVDPQWEGRVGWAPTNGSFQAFITAMRSEFGEQATLNWVKGMVDNGAVEYESNTPVRDAIAAGEVDIGLINHYYVAQAIAEEGDDYPVKVSFPEDDIGSMVNVAGAGQLASSEHRDDSIALIEYMLSPEAQGYFAESSFEYPLVKGVQADPSVVPLNRIPAYDVDLSSISDLNGTLELLREGGAL